MNVLDDLAETTLRHPLPVPGAAATPAALPSAAAALRRAPEDPLHRLLVAVVASETQRRLASPGRRAAKRALDIAGALALLFVLAPVLLVLPLLIRLDSPGPALFRQPRRGLGNRTFRMFKFRTMRYEAADPTGARATLPADARVTRIGRFLRRTSLDELPQLLNVLTGDMSLVGPRPHPLGMTVNGIPYEEVVPGYPARHCVRPGLTGLAQISGARGLVDSPAKARLRIAYDLDYILRSSPGLDLAIMARTALRMFNDEAAY